MKNQPCRSMMQKKEKANRGGPRPGAIISTLCRSRAIRSVESASPLVVESRGKGVALQSPSSNSKKERKLVKVSEGEPKKTKLTASAMLVSRLSRYAFVSVQVFNAFFFFDFLLGFA